MAEPLRIARLLRRELHRAFKDVRDVTFARPCARRLLPTLYVVLLGATAYGLAWLVWATFQLSPWLGFVHLLVVLPLGLFGAAVFFRVLLELGEAVIEIREHTAELGTLPSRVSRWPAMQKLTAITVRRGWITAPGLGRPPRSD